MKLYFLTFILSVLCIKLFAYNYSVGPYINLEVPSIFSSSTQTLPLAGINVTAHIFENTSDTIEATIVVVPANEVPSSPYSSLTNKYVTYDHFNRALEPLMANGEMGYIEGIINGFTTYIKEKTPSTFSAGFTRAGNVYGATSVTTITTGLIYNNSAYTFRDNLYIYVGFDGYNVIIASIIVEENAPSYDVSLANSMVDSFASSYIPNPLSDSDGDGLTNRDELLLHNTNPNILDSNSNGLNDYEELQFRLGNVTIGQLGFSNEHNDYASIVAERDAALAAKATAEAERDAALAVIEETSEAVVEAPSWEPKGWVYYAWPYSYSFDEGVWHWYNNDTLWVLDVLNGGWSTFGSSGN